MNLSSPVGEPPARQRALRTAAAACALLLLPGLSACSFTNPKTTATTYAAADGTNDQIIDEATGASVELRNMLLVAQEEDGPGTLVGVAANTGAQPVRVTFTVLDGDGQSVGTGTVLAGSGELTSIGTDGTAVRVASVPVPPGANLTLVVETPAGGSQRMTLPVLAAEGPYADLLAGPE